MRRILLTAGLVLVISLAVAGVAWAQEPSQDKASIDTIALLLAPILAAATAIERIIEMLFNWYESLILNTSTLLGQGKGYLAWAQEQVHKWRNAIAWSRLSGDALRQAEDALEDAQERLWTYIKSAEYTSRKRVLTLALGILFGLLVAYATRLQMFALLGLEISWPWIDMFVTGLVIGTGSAPVHSLFGLLQNTKDAIDQARALWSGQAYAKGLEAELKRMGIEGDLERLKELQKQMQEVLNALEESTEAVPTTMAAEERRAAVLSARAGREGVRGTIPRPVSSAQIDRRVRRILR